MFESILTIGFVIALLGWIYNKYKLSVYQQIAEMEDASYIDDYVTHTGSGVNIGNLNEMKTPTMSLDQIHKLIAPINEE